MKENVKDFMVSKVNELVDAGSCCGELKALGKAFLEAVGTEKEEEALKALLAEIEEDIMPIEGLISFANSDAGAQVFGGADKAKEVAAHGEAVKAAGGKYCDCPACAACEAILERKSELI